MPVLNVTHEERRLIPYRVQALYELGRISKEQLDNYIKTGSEEYLKSYESKLREDPARQPGALKQPVPEERQEPEASIPAPTSTTEAAGLLWSGIGLQKEGADEVLSLSEQLEELELLQTDPEALSKKRAKLQKQYEDKRRLALSTFRGPQNTQVAELSSFQKQMERLDKIKALDPESAKKYREEIEAKEQAALKKYREGGRMSATADPALSGGIGLTRAGIQSLRNWEQYLPQLTGAAGGVLGGLAGAETGPGAVVTAKLGQAGGAALGSIPIAQTVRADAFARARDNGATVKEANEYANDVVGFELGAEVLASLVPGAKYAPIRRALPGLPGRLAKEGTKAAVRQAVEENITDAAVSTYEVSRLGAGASEAMEATYKQSLPFDEQGRFSPEMAMERAGQTALASALGGSVQSTFGTVVQGKQQAKDLQNRQGLAKQILSSYKTELEARGVTGDQLTQVLDAKANEVSSRLALDKTEAFTIDDISPTKTTVSNEITKKAAEMLRENISRDPSFLAGQVEAQKAAVTAPLKTAPKAQQQTQSQPATGVVPAIELPAAAPLVKPQRVNLTEQMQKPRVRVVTDESGNPKMVEAPQVAPKPAKKKALSKKVIEQKTRATGEFATLARKQIEFEGGFAGLDPAQQQDAIVKRAVDLMRTSKTVRDAGAKYREDTKGKQSAEAQQTTRATTYLRDSDTTLKNLAKSIDQETIDSLVGRGDVQVLPTFNNAVVDGEKVDAGAQGFFRGKDGNIYINAEKAAGKGVNNSELASAILAHEKGHEVDKTGSRTSITKRLLGEGEIKNLAKELQNDNSKLAMAAKDRALLGAYAANRNAVAESLRADGKTDQAEAVMKAETLSDFRSIGIDQKHSNIQGVKDVYNKEVSSYFIEGLLTNKDVPRGKYRRYVDHLVSKARNEVAKTGVKLNIRPKDIEYIIKQELKAQAKGKPRIETGGKTSGKPEDLKSVVYGIGSQRARDEIAEDKGFVDPVYGRKAVEVSDKNASLNPDKIVDGAKLSDVMNHKELYDYSPKVKDYTVKVSPDRKMGEAAFDQWNKSILISKKSADALKAAEQRFGRGSALYKKLHKDLVSSIVHEAQHYTQSVSIGGAERGSNKGRESVKYQNRSNLTSVVRQKNDPSVGSLTQAQKALRADNAAWWMYMANAGEVQARAVQKVLEGEYATYQEALDALSKQFPTLIRNDKDRDKFIDWFNANIAGTENESGDNLNSLSEGGTAKEPTSLVGKVMDTTFKGLELALIKDMRPEQARIAVEQIRGSTDEYKQRAINITNAIVKVANKEGITPQEINAAWSQAQEYGNLGATSSEKVNEGLRQFREMIDEGTVEMIALFERAGVPLSEKLEQTMRDNIGSYLTRSFDINYDKNYGKRLADAAKKGSPKEAKIIADLQDWILADVVSELNNTDLLSDKEARALYKNIFGKSTKSADLARKELDSFKGSLTDQELVKTIQNDILRITRNTKIADSYAGVARDTGILKHRKDIPEAIRAAWGEQTDALESAMVTIVKQRKLLAETRAQVMMLERMPDSFSDVQTKDLTARIDNNQKVYGPLAGKYTTPGMLKFVKAYTEMEQVNDSLMFNINAPNVGARALTRTIEGGLPYWSRTLATLKMWSVLPNPMNWAYNTVAMTQGLARLAPIAHKLNYVDKSGHSIPFNRWALQLFKDVAVGTLNEKTSELYQQALKYNVTGSAFSGDIRKAYTNEIRDTLIGAKSRTTTAKQTSKAVWQNTQHAVNVLFGVWEVISKVATSVAEANQIREANTAAGVEQTYDQVMAEAMDRAKRTNIDRDRAGPAFKLADSLAGGFMTFFSETVRAPFTTIYDGVRQVSDASKAANPKHKAVLQRQGMQKIVGGLSMVAATNLLLQGVARAIGEGFGDDEDKKSALPEDMRRNVEDLIILGKDENGNELIYDTSKLNTYELAMDIVAHVLEGEPEVALEKAGDAAFINPTLTRVIRNVSTDYAVKAKSDLATEISNQIAGTELAQYATPDRLQRVADILKGLIPAPLRETPKVKEYAIGEDAEAREIRETAVDLLVSMGGYPYTYKPEQAALLEISKQGDEIKDAKSYLNRVVSTDNASEQTIMDAMVAYHKAELAVVNKLRPLVRNAIKYGKPQKELESTMTLSGFRKHLKSAILGTTDYDPRKEGEAWLSESENRATSDMSPEEQQRIKKIYKDNKEAFNRAFEKLYGTRGE